MPKVGRCRVPWGMGKGVPSQPTRESGERRELPQRGPANGFWRILKATKRFLYLYDKI